MKRTMLALSLGLALITHAAQADEYAPPRATKAFQHNRFYMGLDGGLLFNGGDDVRQLMNSLGASTSSGIGGTYDLKLGWQSSFGLAVEAGYQGLGRAVNSSTGLGNTTFYFMADESTLFIEPIWRIPVARWFSVGAGLGLGATQDRVIITDSAGGSSTDFSGSGLAYWPELKGQFLMGRHVGLELSLGYRIQESGAIQDASGQTVTLANGNDWHVKNDGLQLGLGLNVYFGRL